MFLNFSNLQELPNLRAKISELNRQLISHTDISNIYIMHLTIHKQLKYIYIHMLRVYTSKPVAAFLCNYTLI